ncbi:hypothetical protein PENDEC_c028G00903 [Penicillium decumbens]|uniref:Mitochondrial export translocase Oxa2 n=1 Tax=Penicillium decumbens TaxID=69771 RepID=A0A1V6NZ23_PENDC|nr:hypothetical protein PENDEC_c028G00903 [Penicillium decumbens]
MAALAMNNLRSMGALRSRPRALPFTYSQVRRFHPTKPTQLIAETLETSTAFIQGIHSVTGLPWVASIPLTAVIVRTVVGTPLQMYTRIVARRERDVAPLIHSWVLFLQNTLRKHPPEAQKRFKKTMQQWTAERKTHLLRKWKIHPGYKYINLLQLPIWLSLMESLRAMTGNNDGLLPSLLSWFRSGSWFGPREHVDLSLTEPTLATEGALWFPDLLAGDPTGVLPVLLSASIIFNVRRGWGITTSTTSLADLPTLQLYQATFFRGLGWFLQFLAINVGVSAMFNGLPAALMIYWITSANVASLQAYLLEKYMFMRPPIPNFKKQFFEYKRPGVPDPFQQKLG